MAAAIHELERALAEFDERNSPRGKLQSYREERISRFYSRVALVLFGACVVAVLIDPIAALAGICIYAVGEFSETTYLKKLPSLLQKGLSIEAATRLAFVASFLQSTGLAIFIVVAWFHVPRESSVILCLSLVGGSTVSAITAMPLNRAIAIMRLSVFAVLILLLVLIEVLRFDTFPEYVFFNVLGAAMLVYLIVPFVMHFKNERGKENTIQRRLLAQGLALAKANASLFAKQQESRRLALVSQRASDAISLIDKQGKIVWVNEAFGPLTGYDAEHVMGKDSSLFFDVPGEVNQATRVIHEGLKNGSSGKVKNKLVTRAGVEKWLETSFGPVYDNEGQFELMFVIDRDVTDIKTREAELEEARFAAENGERAKSSFLATMSHEIRTPMNGIIGMAELLSKSELSSSDRLYVDTIHNSGEALLTIINDILDFSKLNDGHLTIKPAPFRLNACLHEVMNLMRPQAKAKGLELSLHADPDLPPVVDGDDGRLRQILINVIGNAIKFTEYGSVKVYVSAESTKSFTRLNIEVVDSGIGIPEDQIDEIFGRFAQADAATTRRFGGTGLGLSISRSLARLMDGDITVQNNSGSGATFRISLSLGLAEAANEIDMPSPDSNDLSVLKGARVLLAEDNRTNGLVIEKFLQDTPVTLVSARNGQEAVDVLATQPQDIVLMDMSMPVMDGIEATRVIRASDGPQPVIVALTANAYASDREACLEAGMDAFLSKPVRRGKLLHELSRAMMHSQARAKAG